MTNLKQLFGVIAGTMLFTGVMAQEKPLPLDPAVRTGKLPNGFTYYIRHNEEPKNRVVMYIVNNVGSVQEDEDQRGLAHFVEHMNFNGTTHFPHGIWLTKQINDGNATITEIIGWLEYHFQIKIGTAFRRWQSISRRKRIKPTKYLDQMKEAVLRRLDEENSR